MVRFTGCYFPVGKAPMRPKNRRATIHSALITSTKFRRLGMAVRRKIDS
jgi:hypothetical protein